MVGILWLRLKKLRDDYKLLLIMTGLTIAFTFVFTLQGGGGNGQITFGLIDESQSPYAKTISQEIKEEERFNVILLSRAQAMDLLEENEIGMVFHITPEFDETQGQFDVYQLVDTMENLDKRNQILGIINNKMAIRNAAGALSAVLEEDFDEILPTYEATYNFQDTYEVEIKKASLGYWEGYDPVLHSLIGFTLMFSMYTMIFGISDTLQDRKLYTFQRIMVSPITKHTFVFGNLIATMAIASIQIGIVILFGDQVLGVAWGNHLPLVLGIMFLFIFAVTSLGLFLSNFFKTMGQLGASTPILITATSMLGGCMWPLEIVSSDILLTLSNITPQRWALKAIEGVIMHGNPVSYALQPALVLTGFGLVFLLLGIGLTGRNMDAKA